MQKLRVNKLFKWEMAHVLDFHDGKCKNIHGHTYQLEVGIKGSVKPLANKPDSGMIIDFTVLKNIVNEQIVAKLDHTLVIWEKSKWLEKCEGHTQLMTMPVQPTVENLLMWIVEQLLAALPSEVELCQVRMRETPTSWAEWRKED
tara:strand:- start:347003 stop:347437 length:435 start_codon:yes stop_codon:yes gene_type:complete